MNKLVIKDLYLPGQGNTKNEFNIVGFESTPSGSAMIKSVDQREKIKKTIHYVVIAFAILMAIKAYADTNNGKIFNGVVSGAIIYAIGSVVVWGYGKFQVSPIKTKYVDQRWDYTKEMAQQFCDAFDGFSWSFGNGSFFLYSTEVCFLVNAETGGYLGYDRPAIKDVQLNHVQIGSTTVSETSSSGVGVAWTSNVGTYHGSSTTVAKSTSHYEWRFDVYSDFVQSPIMTVVFPDNSEGEEFAKSARAVLM